MSAEYHVGNIALHRPYRSALKDERPAGAYLSFIVGKSRTYRFVRLSVDDLLTIAEDATRTARQLLAEGQP